MTMASLLHWTLSFLGLHFLPLLQRLQGWRRGQVRWGGRGGSRKGRAPAFAMFPLRRLLKICLTSHGWLPPNQVRAVVTLLPLNQKDVGSQGAYLNLKNPTTDLICGPNFYAITKMNQSKSYLIVSPLHTNLESGNHSFRFSCIITMNLKKAHTWNTLIQGVEQLYRPEENQL